MACVCEIPHPIVLVSAKGECPDLDDRLKRGLHQTLTIHDVAAALDRMTEGVPTVLKQEKSDKYGDQVAIYFCTPGFVARCIVKQDAYLLINLNAPEFIYRRLPNWKAIPVRPTGWIIQAKRDQFSSQGFAASYQAIQRHYLAQAGGLARSAPGQEIITPAQQAYLEMLRGHIELARRVEKDRALRRPIVTFTMVGATDAERVFRNTYTFALDRTSPFKVREYVWVGLDGLNPQGQRAFARVREVNGDHVTLKFEDQIDVSRLPCPGLMGAQFNDIQQRIQDRTIEQLRNGQSLNPHVLDVIVDSRYTRYASPDNPEQGPLNPPQNRVLSLAPLAEDIFLVQGPPGTGKTHTITTLAQRLAAHHQKILVTSKNNSAVDNVLVSLEGLRVIRVGHEDKVEPKAEPLLIDVQARTLQQQIIAATEALFRHLERAVQAWKQAEAEITPLHQLAPLWTDRFEKRNQKYHSLRTAQVAVWETWATALNRRAGEAQQTHQQAMRSVQRADQATDTLEWMLARRGWPILGQVAVVISGRLAHRASQARLRADQDRAAFARVARRYEIEVARYQTALQESAPVLAAKEEVRQAEATLRALAETARKSADRLQALLTPSPIQLPCLVMDTPEAFEAYLDKLATTKTVVEQRFRLLGEWRRLMEQRRKVLYPALIRLADVVGATCIGIATDPHFRDLEFDTMIADEAGQIQAFDMLVPLVRARRAVLVGDHKQLPPFVDDEVRALLDEQDEGSIALLEQSLFERLFDAAPATHKAMLNLQYRMPDVIAKFISQTFYSGKYQTAPKRKTDSADPFFDSFICFIDTVHDSHHQERRGHGGEEGIYNPREAHILAQLANAYMDRRHGVGVIVPYKLQVAEVQNRLRRLRPDLDQKSLNEIVATVDSFQGQQRDTILFGFTRSNDWHNVGFLRELRRLNVTITRSQRQLVLVGDSTTLTMAQDADFRMFATTLLDYVYQRGQYMEASQLEEVLRGKSR